MNDDEDATPAEDDPEEGSGGEPLGDLAEEIERRRSAEDEPDLPADELFDESDVEGVDREALWRQVAGEDVVEEIAEADTGVVPSDGATDAGDGPTVQRPDATGSAGGVGARDEQERVVDKGKYCRGCQYFSAPPEVRCTHEGTRIEEEVDMDHFRVVDCPVVREDEELENV